MANTGTLSITGSYTNPIGASQPIGLSSQSYANVVGATQAIVLASGANTITLPSGTTTVIIQFPTGNTAAVILKGVTGDTGIPLNPVTNTKFDPVSGSTSFVITSASAQSSATYITFL